MTIKLKQGETFVVNGQYTEDDGLTPKSLAGVALASQIRTKAGGVVATLDVAVINWAAGTYQMTVPGADGTLAWPTETLYWDIKETIGGVSVLTDTHMISVQRAETRI